MEVTTTTYLGPLPDGKFRDEQGCVIDSFDRSLHFVVAFTDSGLGSNLPDF